MTTIDPTVAATAHDAQAPSRVPTPVLVGAAILVGILLAWANNEFVMTPEVYRRMLGDRMDPDQVDGLVQATERMRLWGYVMVAAGIFVRIAAVALAVQMVGLLLAVELRFRTVVRAAAVALFALLYGDLMRIVWLARLGGGVDGAALSVTPGSVAHLFLDVPETPTLLYGLASQVSPWELIWAALLFLALRATGRVGTGKGVALVSIVWVGFTLFQVGLAVFMARVGG